MLQMEGAHTSASLECNLMSDSLTLNSISRIKCLFFFHSMTVIGSVSVVMVVCGVTGCVLTDPGAPLIIKAFFTFVWLEAQSVIHLRCVGRNH